MSVDEAPGSESEPDVERRLRHALDEERSRSRKLEQELARLRRSEAFRIGHAVAIVGRYRVGRALRFILPRRYRLRLLARAELPAGTPWASDGKSGSAETVVFLAIGGDEDRASRALERIWMLMDMLEAVEPVVVSDIASAELGGERPVAMEHVVPLADWMRFRPAGEWGEYVAERIASVLDEYAPRSVISLSSIDESLAVSSAALSPVILRAMGHSQRNAV